MKVIRDTGLGFGLRLEIGLLLSFWTYVRLAFLDGYVGICHFNIGL